ncbi:MAG: thioredoxin-like domain-containing protein [Chloroherpetonaceae bacterium]|nr:thioredoxin-like domain-containing protein [Chloroherpetonaceae bacterium]MDW8436579.1 thioredoxin-like domain-containing protein [Chloroherpetonaceae bacterium]
MTRILPLSLLFSAQTLLAQITISGAITLRDGSKPTLAHVSIEPISAVRSSPPATAIFDGNYRLSVEKPGFYALLFSSPNCQPARIPVILTEKDKTVRLNVQMLGMMLKPELSKVRIRVKGSKELAEMTREADGTFSFVATATADTFAYQILDANARNRSHNGTQSDYFVYDGGGDYHSVLRVKQGESVKIVFDPKKMPRAPGDATAKLRWDKAHSYLEKFFVISERVETARDEAIAALIEEREKNPGASEIKYDYKPIVSELAAIKNNASERLEARQFAALMRWSLLSFFNKADNAEAEELLRLVPASSVIWAAYPNLLGLVGLGIDSAASARAVQLLTEFKAKNPDRGVQCDALIGLGLYAMRSGDKEKLRAIYNELKEKYADLPDAEYGLKQFNPDRVIQAGNPVPDFEVTLFSGEKVSRASMLGKHYLIDFWAVWCVPCVEELPKMHEAYEKFKGKKGFEILSLSFDDSPQTVEKFRATKFKMPWLHAHLAGAFNHEIAKRFEVIVVPKPILVDDKGYILAVDGDLRGENLEKTLSKHLGEASD